MSRSSVRPSVIILTFNSAKSIERTLRKAVQVSDDIHVVDSYSSDNTLEICRSFSCKIVQRPFVNYADQRNWAIDNLALASSWQLHLDADEELTVELIEQINSIDFETSEVDGWIFGRKVVFLGTVLRYGSIAKTWHYRLFRSGFGRCELRLYDQHFVSKGTTSKLNAFMLDHQEATLSEWTASHNRWADMEAAEMDAPNPPAEPGSTVRARLLGSRIERKRFLKSQYYRLPLFVRPFGYFIYTYVICLGFLDGKPGLIFHFLQGCWFRFLIDAKLYEKRLQRSN